MRLHAMLVRRSKTDHLDAQLLANLLRLYEIPLAYIPSEAYQTLRDLTRYRATLSRQGAQAKLHLRQLLARENIHPPYKYPFGPRGLYWFSRQDFGPVGNQVRDHALERLRWTSQQCKAVDQKLEEARVQWPQIEALLEHRGIGLFTALLIVGEFGDVTRFHTAKQAGVHRPDDAGVLVR